MKKTDNKIFPAFKKNNIPIVFSVDNHYIPYLSIVLISIKKNSSIGNNYDILVLNRDINEKNEKKLKSIFEKDKNFSLRFINIDIYNDKVQELWTYGHFSLETWFRLLLPDILEHYDKIIYLDSDLIVEEDLAKLYSINLNNNYLLAATRDVDSAGLYNGYDPKKKTYLDNVLKIKKPYNYFQAGVLLLNLNAFRKQYSVKDILKFAGSRHWDLLDQDVLNYLAQGKTKLIDMSWNTVYDWGRFRIKNIIKLAPEDMQQEYLDARKAPKIIHYAGPDKPWNDPSVDFADNFWIHAKESPFYNELKERMPSLLKRFVKKSKFLIRRMLNRIFPDKIKI